MENDLSYLRHSQNRDFCPLKRGSGANSTHFPLFEGIEGELESAVKILRRAPEYFTFSESRTGRIRFSCMQTTQVSNLVIPKGVSIKMKSAVHILLTLTN